MVRYVSWVLPLLVACSAAPPEPEAPSDSRAEKHGGATQTRDEASTELRGVRPKAPLEPAAPVPPPVEDGSAWGGPYPTSLWAAGPSRNWAVLCQARSDTNGNGRIAVSVSGHGELSGDQLATYLIRAGKPELVIDDFLGSDPTGQHIIYRKGDQTWLLDTISETRLDLGATGTDLADDASSYTQHRAISFGLQGRRLATLRRDSNGTNIVIRDLKTGSESVHAAGPGTIGRMTFEPDGQFIRLDVVTTDSNGNGRIQWPFPPRSDRAGSCPGPIPSYNVWQWPGDDARVRLLDLATSKTHDVDDFVMTVGGSVIIRNDEGALFMRLPNGERRKVSSKQCAAKVLHVDAETESVVFGCAGAYAARRDIYVRTATGRRRLELDLAPFELDSRLDGRPSWFALYPRNDTVMLHLSSATPYPVTPETRVLGTYGTHALAERAENYYFLSLEDPDARSTKLVEAAVGKKRMPVTDIVSTDRYVAVGSDLFDVASLRSLGRFERPPLALSNDGYGFVPTKSPQMRALSEGPLHWKRPTE